MIYVIMRRDRKWQFVEAVAAFDNHVTACEYADRLDNENYAYRVDSVHFNLRNLKKRS
jgi:hypothetical protein